MIIASVSALDCASFVALLGGVFEHSPWVAERAWARRPFGSREDLHAAMTRIVDEALEAEQLALLRAHPDLGARAKMTDASTGEQRGAGLDRLTPDQFARLQRLNDAYKQKFGFPFIYAVKGSTVEDIFTALEQRGGKSKTEEFAEALQQVGRIAGLRLVGLIEE